MNAVKNNSVGIRRTGGTICYLYPWGNDQWNNKLKLYYR